MFFNQNDLSKEAKELIRGLPTNISNYVLEKLENGYDETIKYFEENSPISSILMADPGSHEMLELIYTGENIHGEIDNYFYNCLAGQALRNRLSCITNKLNTFCKDNFLNILNLGCGTARDTIGLKNKTINAYCVDVSTDALEIGISLSRQHNMNNIKFIHKSMTELPKSYYGIADIVLLIGIFCSLDDRVCSIILKKIKKYLKPGAIVIASNVSEKMLQEDPFTAFLLEKIIGWKLVYKTPERLKKIFEHAGFNWIENELFYDEPYQFHMMGVAKF